MRATSSNIVGAITFKRSCIVMFVFFGLFVIFDIAAPYDTPLRLPIGDIGMVLASFLATVLCLFASRSGQSARAQWSWRLFFVYNAAAWATQVAIFYCRITESITPDLVTVTTTLYIINHLTLFVGLILRIPRNRGVHANLAATLDALVLTVGVSAPIWQYILAPILATATSPWEGFLGLGVPAASIGLVFAMLAMVMGWSLERVSVTHLFLLGNLFMMVLGSIGNVYLLIQRAFETGNLLAAAFTLGAAMFAMAALSKIVQMSSEESGTASGWVLDLSITRPARMLLPYVSLPVAGAPLFLDLRQHPDLYPILTIFALLVLLIMVRQFVTLSQSAQISARQRDLNQMARQLSLCQTSIETMSIGLQESCKVLDMRGGLLWMPGENGELKTYSHLGLTEWEHRTLGQVSELPARLARHIGGGNLTVIKANEMGTMFPEWTYRTSLVIAPLLSRGAVLGSLGLLTKLNHDCREEDYELIEAVAGQLGVTLENSRHLEEVTRLADRDGVTGLLNHRAVHERLRQEMTRASRLGGPLTVLMTDIDHFKSFNDTYGHPAGDQVIKRVASALHSTLRACDIVGRYGGDEFIGILVDTDSNEAQEVISRLGQAIAGKPYVPESGQVVPISASFGLACYPCDARQIEQLVAFADAQMYRAKHDCARKTTKRERAADSDTDCKMVDRLVEAVDR